MSPYVKELLKGIKKLHPNVKIEQGKTADEIIIVFPSGYDMHTDYMEFIPRLREIKMQDYPPERVSFWFFNGDKLYNQILNPTNEDKERVKGKGLLFKGDDPELI